MDSSSRIKRIAAGVVSLGGVASGWLVIRIFESTFEETADAALGPISKRIEQLERAPQPSAKDLEQLAQLREIRAEMEQALRDLASRRPWNADRLEDGEPS